MLMLLLSGQRGQTLLFLVIRNLSLSEYQVTFGIGDLLNTSCPGAHLSGLVLRLIHRLVNCVLCALYVITFVGLGPTVASLLAFS